MHVGVGYSDNPDSKTAGIQVATNALESAKRQGRCDMALLFCTARHNQEVLRDAVASVVGRDVPIYGGGAVGIITNEAFGYAGDQVGIACLWMDGADCRALSERSLLEGEEVIGERLGRRLAASGVTPDSPVMLFYDAVDRNESSMRLLMATWILAGLEKGLGFLPDLTGAGMQGDHVCTPTCQFTGEGISGHNSLALAFSDEIRIDSTILHGCRPASQYYTVTKAEGPMILEINGEPALSFMDTLLGPSLAPEEYPFFLLFGINHGEKWGEYDENNYASRLCLGIDKERGGIVMFEPDMVAGTRFQLMFRSLDYDYMKPKIEALFDELDGREPVFAVYIDCAGRAAGYGGIDMEDAVVVQETVGGRVPLLGLYTGVEIASIGGRPRGLDWTGVFCLFSRGKSGEKRPARKQVTLWEAATGDDTSDSIPQDALTKLCEQNAAKVLSLDTQSIAIRHELEQKRRGFSLLAELSVSLRKSASYESLFIPVAQRINAALNMQKTAVLIPTGVDGIFVPSVLQGYTIDEKAQLAGKSIAVPAEMLDPEQTVLVTAADDTSRMASLRETLLLPYFIASPVILQNEVAAVLITGRMVEAPPFLSRLGRSDTETVQAISALLASVLIHRRLEAAEERAYVMLNAMPMCCVFWDENGNQTDCNEEALRLFGVPGKADFLERFYRLAPAQQPDGRPSEETLRALVLSAFITGHARFEWIYLTQDGEPLPAEVTLVRVPRGEDYTVAGYIRDLREQKAAVAEISRARDLAEQNVRAKSEFLAAVSHEVRTPVNAILAMARAVSQLEAEDSVRQLIDQGMRSARLLTAAIDSILDFSMMDAGKVSLESKAFNAADIVASVSNLLSEEASGKNLTLRTEIVPDLPQCVLGDATRLEQAVFNLTANAVKFTETGEVVIRLRTGDKPYAGMAQLVFEVSDTGIGIPSDQLESLFEPLTVIDTSYSRRQGGLGMGLAITRSLAQLMDGTLSCQSEEGKGSTFVLSVALPLPAADVQIQTEETAAAAHELAGLRVLVAEDNPINQIIVEELLNAVGIKVVTANNGLEALSALEHNEFDLVLMDIQMPEMDGLTAAAQIRTNPRYDNMPILAMTANSAAEHREESLKSGMNDHLTKPIDVDEVYAALKYWGRRGG